MNGEKFAILSFISRTKFGRLTAVVVERAIKSHTLSQTRNVVKSSQARSLSDYI